MSIEATRIPERRPHPEIVPFSDQLPFLLARAKLVRQENEDIADLAVWQRAFPDIEWLTIDEGLTGKEIEWNTYTATEMAAYVAYMNDPQWSRLRYRISINGVSEAHEITDSERIWYCWFEHTFRHLEDPNALTYDAKMTLAYYAAQGQFEEIVMDAAEDGDIDIPFFAPYFPKVE